MRLFSMLTALAVVLVACQATTETPATSAQDVGMTQDAGVGADVGVSADAAPAEVAQATDLPGAPTPYEGTCPELGAGWNYIQSGGFQRKFRVFLPETPAGAPVLFAWHGLGDSAPNFAKGMGAEQMAKNLGIVVVVPESCGATSGASGCDPGLFTWGWNAKPDSDARLFDDLLACLDQTQQIDRHRIYTVGFSAGALWTTWLLMHRAERLAAAVVFSGGVNDLLPYERPAYKLPVLLAWGGETDLFANGIIDFAAATTLFSKGLRQDGHFVVGCNHDSGHTVPFNGPKYAMSFLLAHEWKDGGSPLATSGLVGFPDYCHVEP
jgi:dienelactone hydrolase